MRLSPDDFEYDYPPELIAQHPSKQRDGGRLLSLDRTTGEITHRAFRDFPCLLHANDIVVVNSSRVIKARLLGQRDNGRPAEVLLVHPDEDDQWLAMVHPGGKLKRGRIIRFGEDVTLEVVGVVGGGLRRVKLSGMSWTELMESYGTVPLPPYIDRAPDANDTQRYQTMFAREPGSVAAPTAGLHFAPDTVEQIHGRGATIADVTLHVGPGTFKPVQVDDLARHVMHSEWFQLPAATANGINSARAAGGRVWAIGTTVARVLETVAADCSRLAADCPDSAADKTVRAAEGWTDLFIYPPHQFRVLDGLLTNFHLSRSTLLMLVCAFGGYERVMTAYRTAVANRYQLYSYGDAMIIA